MIARNNSIKEKILTKQEKILDEIQNYSKGKIIMEL